jgi:hypothetical protein
MKRPAHMTLVDADRYSALVTRCTEQRERAEKAEAYIEALERADAVMRLLLQRVLCDCQPRALGDVAITSVASTHDFGCAYRREMQPVLAALRGKEER